MPKSMDKRSARISIVIPAYNEERHLRACLEAIASQTVRPYEVIVADNNSTDGTPAIAAAFSFVRVIPVAAQGIVHARNAGFDAARGDVIGRIDADIVLPTNWVAHVQEFYSQSANDTPAREAWTGAGYFYNVRLPRLTSWGYGVLAFSLNKLLTGHYTLWGSNMAITVEQWRAVRGAVHMRTDIHEDLDLALHLADHGYEIRYDRTIKTTAELRRLHTDHHKLWGYLQWWPRTLRLHGRPGWLVCWLFGALGLYVLSFAWLAIDRISQLLHIPSRDTYEQ